jgi:hypothetical protein
LTARWEEDEGQEKYWLALAREDELKARQLRAKAVEIASQEISLDAAKVLLRELRAKNTQESAGQSLQELPTENIKESPRKNLRESSAHNTQESLRESAVSVLSSDASTSSIIRARKL